MPRGRIIKDPLLSLKFSQYPSIRRAPLFVEINATILLQRVLDVDASGEVGRYLLVVNRLRVTKVVAVLHGNLLDLDKRTKRVLVKVSNLLAAPAKVKVDHVVRFGRFC